MDRFTVIFKDGSRYACFKPDGSKRDDDSDGSEPGDAGSAMDEQLPRPLATGDGLTGEHKEQSAAQRRYRAEVPAGSPGLGLDGPRLTPGTKKTK